jgi:hypothetical protein
MVYAVLSSQHEPAASYTEGRTLSDDKPICELTTTVRDGSGDICLTGRATVYTVPLDIA